MIQIQTGNTGLMFLPLEYARVVESHVRPYGTIHVGKSDYEDVYITYVTIDGSPLYFWANMSAYLDHAQQWVEYADRHPEKVMESIRLGKSVGTPTKH